MREGTNRRTNCCRRKSSLRGVTSYKLKEEEQRETAQLCCRGANIIKLIKLQESAEKSSRTVLMFVAEKERKRGKNKLHVLAICLSDRLNRQQQKEETTEEQIHHQLYLLPLRVIKCYPK